MFESFWRAFPSKRKTGKLAAEKAFRSVLKLASAETIIAAAKEYAASPVGNGEYVKGPTPWLTQGCWNDDRAAWQRSDSQRAISPDDPRGNSAAAQRYLEGDDGE
jgi:hypothetical protein